MSTNACYIPSWFPVQLIVFGEYPSVTVVEFRDKSVAEQYIKQVRETEPHKMKVVPLFLRDATNG